MQRKTNICDCVILNFVDSADNFVDSRQNNIIRWLYEIRDNPGTVMNFT
jgi:hypothetical protein